MRFVPVRSVGSAAALVLAASAAVAAQSATPASTLPTGVLSGAGWLAWQSSDLSIADLATGERRPLFSDGVTRQAGHPDWSPDGAHVVYRVDEPDGTADIHITARDGTGDRLLIDCIPPCVFAEDPAWSPDGSRIAYWTNGDGQPQIIVVADAATGETLVTVPAPDPLIGPVTPRWSPDGRYLAAHAEVYEQNGDDYVLVDGRIGLIDLQSASPVMELITPVGMKAMYPDWSPEGDRILFLAGNLDPFFGNGDPTDLYTIDPATDELVQLTHRRPGEPVLGGPTWTRADPPILITLIGPGGDLRLGGLEADGSGVRELADHDGNTFAGAHPRVWVAP